MPTVTAAFSTQEEVGLRGAKITAERLRPALAICLEGTPADDNFTAPDEAQGALKKGVQIRFRDGSMVAHPGLVAFARRVAEENNIPHQCAVRTGGGTNGGSIHLAPGGVPTLVLGIPGALCAHALRLFCRRRCRRRHCASPAPSCARLRPTCSVCSTPWPDAYIKQSAVQ